MGPCLKAEANVFLHEWELIHWIYLHDVARSLCSVCSGRRSVSRNWRVSCWFFTKKKRLICRRSGKLITRSGFRCSKDSNSSDKIVSGLAPGSNCRSLRDRRVLFENVLGRFLFFESLKLCTLLCRHSGFLDSKSKISGESPPPEKRAVSHRASTSTGWHFAFVPIRICSV